MNTKPLRYEVDLSMLPPGSTAGDLAPFCAALERVMGEDGDEVTVVPTFQALNDGTNKHLVAWGWPTEPQWDRALRLLRSQA
jgi:hypothetical protein